MGGLARMVFDPMNISGAFSEDSPTPSPMPPPAQDIPTTWNENGSGEWVYTPGKGNEYVPASPPGYIQGMTGPSTGLVLPNVGEEYGPQNDSRPREAPFKPQWQYARGKGPQWLEPVDNGVSLKRDGDVAKAVDNGWSSTVNKGPFKGNRI